MIASACRRDFHRRRRRFLLVLRRGPPLARLPCADAALESAHVSGRLVPLVVLAVYERGCLNAYCEHDASDGDGGDDRLERFDLVLELLLLEPLSFESRIEKGRAKVVQHEPAKGDEGGNVDADELEDVLLGRAERPPADVDRDLNDADQ